MARSMTNGHGSPNSPASAFRSPLLEAYRVHQLKDI
jgi:hypothetical protein